MDASAYAIRPFADTDFEVEARIARETDPEHAPSVEEIRHWDEVVRLERDHVFVKLAAVRRDTQETVGLGSISQPAFNYDPRWFWIWVAVAPAHRRNGVGAELFSRLEGEALQRNGLGLWGSTREGDVEGERFLERRGFRIRQRIWLSRLDLANLDLSAVPDRSVQLVREGFRFSTLAEDGGGSPETRRNLYHLAQLSGADIPRLGRFHPVSFEEFVAIDIEGPGSMHEGTFLAWKGSSIVGMSSLERDLARPETLRVGYTGTDPTVRGRGIGTELKRRATVFARERGYRYLVTGNNSLNRPILSINRRFGFRAETVWIQGEKSLERSPAPG